jgi:hypothetical protein
VLSIIALPAAWYWWSQERVDARWLEQSLRREAAMEPMEGRVASNLSAWKLALANVATVQEKVKFMGEVPEQWTKRSITLDNQRMSRVEAQKYLRELTNDEQNLMLPSTIFVKAAKPGESLFAADQGQDAPESLIVTIKADLYSRGAQ